VLFFVNSKFRVMVNVLRYPPWNLTDIAADHVNASRKARTDEAETVMSCCLQVSVDQRFAGTSKPRLKCTWYESCGRWPYSTPRLTGSITFQIVLAPLSRQLAMLIDKSCASIDLHHHIDNHFNPRIVDSIRHLSLIQTHQILSQHNVFKQRTI
jgi:hypothetical protein